MSMDMVLDIYKSIALKNYLPIAGRFFFNDVFLCDDFLIFPVLFLTITSISQHLICNVTYCTKSESVAIDF